MADPNLSEIVTTTLRNRSGVLADNVSDNNALLNRLRRKGNQRLEDGGRTIVQELDYADNGTVQWYSGYEALSIAAQTVLSAAEFDWKQLAGSVTMSGYEQLVNSGDSRVINWLTGRITNLERSLKNAMSVGVYSDGTGSSSKTIGGLQLLVADAPTSGIVGGINRATYSFWQNQVYDATSDGGASASSTNIQRYMNALYIECSRGADRPDLIVADNDYYECYLNSLQTIQRIASDEMGQAGFTSLKYMGADVVLDGGIGGAIPTEHMYMLNTDFIHFVTHSGRNLTQIGSRRESTNQDAFVEIVGWMGNLTLSNAFLQGVLKD